MTLYNLRFKGLLSRDLVKATRQGLETPEYQRRAIADKGDIFYARISGRASYYLFMGCCIREAVRLAVFLWCGCFQPRLQPPPSRLETENGEHSKTKGARHDSISINPFKRNHSNRTQPLFTARNVRTDRTDSMLREVSYVC